MTIRRPTSGMLTVPSAKFVSDGQETNTGGEPIITTVSHMRPQAHPRHNDEKATRVQEES